MVQVIARSWYASLFAKVIALLTFPLLILTVYTFDQTWEVIGDFGVDSQLVTPKGVYLEGTLDKRRPCKFIEATALTSDEQFIPVRYEQKRTYGGTGTSRPLGVQKWGPWVMDAKPGEKIFMSVRHRCHFAWEHTEPLTSFIIAPESIEIPK